MLEENKEKKKFLAESEENKKNASEIKNTLYSGVQSIATNSNISTAKVKKISIQFKENRKFDLHIGRNMVTFFGRESKQIPENWLSHKDWQSVKNYFLIKGV